MIKKIFLIISLSLIIISCNSKKIKNTEKVESLPPEVLYIQAMDNVKNNKYTEAIKIFEAIEKKYPLSNEAVQAQIMSGFIDYLTMEYQSAIFKFNRIIQKYPSHKNIDYVYYMKAICYFEQINHEELDNNSNIQSLKSFNQILTRFPNSEYAKDSKMKIVLVKENMAAKHMDVGRFYLKNHEYIAAMNRFKKVIDQHSKSKFTPEALYRLVEIYYKIGMIEDAKKTASVISFNYPKSKWYKYSYNLLVEEDKNESFFKKIKNKIIRKNKDGKKS